ncbi:hypothetical protein SAMN05444377_1103 [Flavobacterium fontis]|uniref:PH domain-containing protein n=1 Tax=Flavobacterium fontis TaxID=1124188 RepID=A0A1M5BWZ4_9FLAO|nr:STM3941 family protein [Flavobacterium fontis]SHF47133.1 hypothetical protein SAMN05444377_1103 [Flavobacterium fontis]
MATTLYIPQKKTKLWISLLGAICFVSMGFFILSKPQSKDSWAPIFGWGSILFFGLTGVLSIIKLLDTRPALIINDKGIWDNTTFMQVGLISWHSITKITHQKVVNNHFIFIYTKDPEVYLNKVSGISLRILRKNQQGFGTPFTINGNGVRYNITQLHQLLESEWEKHRK